jgi:hypothetical protein
VTSPPVRVKQVAKRRLLELMERLLSTDEGRSVVSESLSGTLAWRPPLAAGLRDLPQPYGDLDHACAPRARVRAPIIITARFRTGSTLLWNLFRHLPGMTAYYEPFNQRRWFDASGRRGPIDPTHRHVDDYSAEYTSLNELGRYFQNDWAERRLLMGADAWDPAMRRYVELLIERAPGRPVLQFNQIDFRLPWFRRNFPNAALVHLYRHPRDQWCSSLVHPTRFPKEAPLADFVKFDEFYLLAWAQDLKPHFPFLDERVLTHPYELFYFLWKLSYLFGVQYADYSLAFEELVQDPRRALERLLRELGVETRPGDLTRITDLVDPPPAARWRAYADDEWFREHERRCEAVLMDFLVGQPA